MNQSHIKTRVQQETQMSSIQLARITLLVAVLALALAPSARGLTLLRDPDIEHALGRLAKPVLKAANLNPGGVDILVIDDDSVNAFVVDRHNIFLHFGLIMKMRTADMLQSVIAHEAAHITNGHLIRRPINLGNARTAAGIGAVLGAAAAAVAGSGEAAIGFALGAQTAAIRRFFAHTRSEEFAADQSGVRYLASAGADPQAAVEVLDIFRGQEALPDAYQDPYARTHPLGRDRYRVVKRLADAYGDSLQKKDDSDYWFQRAKAKLSAFKRPPKWTLSRAGETGYEDIKHMREAVAWHLRSNPENAIKSIDMAIALKPEDPYFLELKGQILMESGRFGEAVDAYGQATGLAPRNALILGEYGSALLARGETEKALEYLMKANERDSRSPKVMRELASAHAKMGNMGMAALATAERYALLGLRKDASIHAKRAVDLLPEGSTGWNRAQDVLYSINLVEN